MVAGFRKTMKEANQMFSKVKAHAGLAIIRGKMEGKRYVNNPLAYAVEDAAASLGVNWQAVQKAEMYGGIAFKIARRIAVIEANSWDDIPQRYEVPLENPRQVLANSVDGEASRCAMKAWQNGHLLQRRKDYNFCTGCRKRRKYTAMKFWMETICNSAPDLGEPRMEVTTSRQQDVAARKS